MTKRNPEFGGFSACFAVRAETDRKGKATPPARTETCSRKPNKVQSVISTHSARKDGDYNWRPWFGWCDISTHSAREDGDKNRVYRFFFLEISTHSARKDGDTVSAGNGNMLWIFQPTPPTRTETQRAKEIILQQKISTHSAHEDGDQ